MAEPRFEDCPQQVVNAVEAIREEYFPELDGARIKCVFDLKKRMAGGKLTIARIQRANDMLRFLTIEEAESTEGYDYFLFMDKLIFEACSIEDQERIIRHELRHTEVDVENERNPWKLRGHEITDFYDEIQLNSTDPRWAERVATLGESLYDPENDPEE